MGNAAPARSTRGAYNVRATLMAEATLSPAAAPATVAKARFCRAMLMAWSLLAAGAALPQEMSSVPPARTESLELPGLTAGCHVCEWRPKLHQMPAAAQCGTDAEGLAHAGLYECGFSPECSRECHFVGCAER